MQLQHIGGCRTMLPQIIRAQPTQKRPAANAGAAAPTRTNAPTRVDGTHPAQSQAAQPPKSAPAAIAAAAASSRTNAPTRVDGTHPAQSQAAQPPKSAPAANAGAAAPTRTNPIPSDTATQKRTGGHSRRSSIQQDKSTHARRRATHPAQSQAAQPPPKRTGGQSRRSSARQNKRANARRRT